MIRLLDLMKENYKYSYVISAYGVSVFICGRKSHYPNIDRINIWGDLNENRHKWNSKIKRK